MSEHFALQDALYQFPYHHIPNIERSNERVRLSRSLGWGLEYLCYQMHVIETIEKLDPESVLEVGCGDGFMLGNLNPAIPKRVGVDYSSRAIEFAKAFFPHCEFTVGRASEIGGQFDVVAAIEVLEHVPDLEVPSFFKELEGKLRSHGTAIITVPTTVVLKNKKHYRHYDEDLFRKQLEDSGTSLSIVKMERVYKESALSRVVSKLVANRAFTLEVNALSDAAWAHVWRRCRIASKNNGRHLVATLRGA